MKRDRRTPLGVTLVELLVVLGLFLLGLSVVLINYRPRSSSSSNCRGLAQTLASDIRAARNSARSSGQPQAVAFPSGDATSPCSQAYYILGGVGHIIPRKITDTSTKFPDAYMYVGTWPGKTFGIGQVGGLASIPMNDWLKPKIRDFIFLFDTSGRLISNDIPHDSEGNHYIVVCDGLKYASSAVPPGSATVDAAITPGYFDLSAVNHPYTLTISPAGSVSVKPGLPDASVAVSVTDTDPSKPGAPIPAPPTVSAFNNKPVIDKLTVVPNANPLYPGFDATVSSEGRLSLTVFAYDTDGDSLRGDFLATGGNFTFPKGSSRTLKPSWQSSNSSLTVDWSPPPGAAPGSTFKLDVKVVDTAGEFDITSGTATIDVGILSEGRIVFESEGDIYTMDGGGTLPSNKTKGEGKNSWPCLSPDGKTIAFVSDRDLEYRDKKANKNVLVSGRKRIWLMDVSGYDVRPLTNVDGSTPTTIAATKDTDDDFPSWAGDGKKLVFTRKTAASEKLQIIGTDGAFIRKDIDDGTQPCWSYEKQTGQKDIVYVKPGVGIRKTDVLGSAITLVGDTKATDPVWSPDGDRLLYLLSGDLQEAKNDGSGQSVKFAKFSGRPAFNPNGQKVLVAAGNAPMLYQDGGLGTPLTLVGELRPVGFSKNYSSVVHWSKGR